MNLSSAVKYIRAKLIYILFAYFNYVCYLLKYVDHVLYITHTVLYGAVPT